MNFNLLFATISSLFFTIEFGINITDRQDFLFFEGENQTAHLYRFNNTVCFYLNQDEKTYQCCTNVSGDTFTFTWQGFLVNDKKMQQCLSTDKIPETNFNKFSFLSPLVEYFYNKADVEPVYSIENSFNYWYIVLIVFIFGVLFESKSYGILLLQRLFSKHLMVNQHDQVPDQNIQITNV